MIVQQNNRFLTFLSALNTYLLVIYHRTNVPVPRCDRIELLDGDGIARASFARAINLRIKIWKSLIALSLRQKQIIPVAFVVPCSVKVNFLMGSAHKRLAMVAEFRLWPPVDEDAQEE